MKAYAITIGFDNDTTKTIQGVINRIAETANNDYMISNGIEPHITIGAFMAEKEKPIIEILDIVAEELRAEKVLFEGIESFSPNVVYISPRKNDYLSSLNQMINEKLLGLFAAADHEYYMPQNWVPHCALAVQLNEHQHALALNAAGKIKLPFSASVDKISLAECMPYKRIKVWEI